MPALARHALSMLLLLLVMHVLPLTAGSRSARSGPGICDCRLEKINYG